MWDNTFTVAMLSDGIYFLGRFIEPLKVRISSIIITFFYLRKFYIQ